MPAPRIRADYDQLLHIAQIFDQQAETTEGTLRDMAQRMQVLQGGDWIGQGAQAFYSEMEQSILPTFKRLVDALHAAAQTTQAIIGEVKGAEQGASSTFNKGASNVAAGRSAEGMAAAGGATAAGIATGAAAGATLPAWLNQLLGGNGSQNSGDALDQFTNELHNIRDSLAASQGTGSGFDAGTSDSDFPSQQILDAVKQDLASQSQAAANGWDQQGAGNGAGAGAGGGSGSGSGGGSGAGSGSGSSGSGGGGSGGGGADAGSFGGGGSMGAGGNSQVSGQQGMVSNVAAALRGDMGGLFGGSDGANSFGAAVVAGITRSAAGGAPIAQVVLTVGASAGGLLFATKGSGQAGGVGGWASGQFAQHAASPIYRAARG